MNKYNLRTFHLIDITQLESPLGDDWASRNTALRNWRRERRTSCRARMLPTDSRGRPSSSTSRPNTMLLQYLRRIVKWQQMDVEYGFWQMLHLCNSPKVVYQYTKYHKQTKNQWARDDPAFAVICSLLLTVANLAYCVAYDHGVSHSIFVVITVLVFHFLILGPILATCCWLLTNAYLREESPNSHVVEQRVEWLYAFDVHCNSFFPLFVLIYVIHYLISPLLVAHGFIPVLLSNLLVMVVASCYHYLNFLGYDVLPFLERTTFFLYPIGVVIVLPPICKSSSNCSYLLNLANWSSIIYSYGHFPPQLFSVDSIPQDIL